jgi:hypothetical protein
MVLLLAGSGFPLLSAPCACSQAVGEAEVVIVAADVFLRWYGRGGRTYFIQAADPNGPLLGNDPLQRWVWQDVIEFGNNEEISYEVGSTAGKGFFRLHSTGQSPPPGVSLEDWDADGDGLSNALELQLQTHPLHPDTSGDGIPDGWAHAHGLNPLANNAAGFFQGGGLTNLQAFQAGVQGHPAATLANLDGDSLDNEVDADPRERVIDWAPTGHPAFAAIELDVNDVEELLLDDFTESGSVLLTRIQNHAPVGRIVIDRNLVPHTFPHGATPTAGAPFVGYGPTLVGEKVAGARLVNGVVTDSLWDPLANTFATWQRPFGYDSDIRDERGGIYLGRNWLGLSPDGLRRSPDGDLLPGENLVRSWDARIEGNGNIVSDQGYWRKDPVSGALGNVRRFPATPSGVRSATLVQGSPAVEWHLVASHSGLMVAKDGGAFVQASGELKDVPVHGVTRQGWVADTHQDRIRANGQWHPMVNLLGGGDSEEADLLDIMDTGLAIAKIRRTGQPLRLAMLMPVDLDIVHPATGELDEAKQHDPTKGGYVAVRRDDGTPVTKLVIHQGVGLEGRKYKVKFNGADKFKLWKDEARTQVVVSEQTEFDPAQETTLYFEGLKKSASVGAETITLQAVINGTATDAETIYATVVEAEFDVWLNVFIPPQWTDFPATHPIHIDYVTNPLDPYPMPTPIYRRKIAAGDDRSFNDEFFDDPASAVDDIIGETGSRAHMQVTVIPFKDLDLDGIKDDSYKSAIGESHNYRKEGSVPDPDANYSAANRLLPQPIITQSGREGTQELNDPSGSIERYGIDQNAVRFRFEGSADNPIVNPSPAIDWNFQIAVTANNDNVLAPKWILLGDWQDGFPGYEIYIRDSDGSNGDNKGTAIYQYDPIPLGRTPFDLFPDSVPGAIDEQVTAASGDIP